MDFEKLRLKNLLRPHENAKATFSNSSGLKSVVFVGVNGRPNCRRKAAISNFSSVVWTRDNLLEYKQIKIYS